MPHAKTERLLGKLQKVRQVKENEWKACCPLPGHNNGTGDNEPSLGIKEIDDKILLHCWSECNNEDIMEYLGMTTGDLFFAELDPEIRQQMAKDAKRKQEEQAFRAASNEVNLGLTRDLELPESLDNERIFKERYGYNRRYCYPLARWFIWDGTR